jgi:hypothetical protein
MTDEPEQARPSYGAFIFFRLVQASLLVALVFLTYTQATSAYVNTQKAIEAMAVANNAAVKQRGEALLLSKQATTALEMARNAAERTKAEAEALDAEGDKIRAEATAFYHKAMYAEEKVRADALTIGSEFELRKAKAFAGLAELRNVARKEKAEVEKIEAGLYQHRQAVEQLRRLRRSGMGAFFGR